LIGYDIVSIDKIDTSFGSKLDQNGVYGRVEVLNPITGCSAPPLKPAQKSKLSSRGDSSSLKTIAFVLYKGDDDQDDCSPQLKVYNAQQAGYDAVIIQHYYKRSNFYPFYESKPKSNETYDIKIPSVYIDDIRCRGG
jgi:hypothetical protein